MTDDEDRTDARPGPDPERLKLPHEDWKEALREALEEGPLPDEEKPEPDEDDDAE